jgi:hypothetical protein
MDKTYQRVFEALRVSREPGGDTSYADSRGGRADARVAWLLLVLSELEECIAGMEELPIAELSALISNAILSCGFESPGEERYAIRAVLTAIEAPASPGWS